MFMGGPGRLLGQEVTRPQSTGATLKRFWRYFGQYRLVLLLVAVFVVSGVYMQVLAPDLIGQAVDCYLTPVTAQALGGSPLQAGGITAHVAQHPRGPL
jgi:ABC-type multidrug transport system fused ATPase/permease subunit